jgi:hypothetical protein
MKEAFVHFALQVLKDSLKNVSMLLCISEFMAKLLVALMSMDNITKPLKMAANYVERISRGDIP